MRRLRYYLLTAGLVLAGGSTGEAQVHDHGGGADEAPPQATARQERAGQYPVSFIARPAPLRPGVGGVHYPATTSSELARAYYEQGLAYIYLYHEVEAARSFHQALRFDPEMALAYIGLHRAYRRMNAGDHADGALARAVGLAPQVNERDRVRIELAQAAAEARRDGDLREAYLARIDAALERFPDDAEFLTLRALNASGEARIEGLRQVLQRDPEHVGAHHELVHAHESRREYEDAVAHGEILARLAPGIAHARHMFGHNLMRVQRVPDALHEFSAADSVERAYFRMEDIPPEYDWHHPHNLHLLALTLWHQGRLEEAESVLRDRAKLVQANGLPAPWNRTALLELLLRASRTDEVLDGAAELTVSSFNWVRTAGHLLEAEALILAGRIDEAAAALEASGADATSRGEAGRWRERLHGAVLLHSDPAEGERRLWQVIPTLREDRGPDGWIVSLMHLDAIAAMARTAGAWELALHAARELIDHDPSYAGGHHALALAAAATGDTATANAALAEASRLWRDAGADRALLMRAVSSWP